MTEDKLWNHGVCAQKNLHKQEGAPEARGSTSQSRQPYQEGGKQSCEPKKHKKRKGTTRTMEEMDMRMNQIARAKRSSRHKLSEQITRVQTICSVESCPSESKVHSNVTPQTRQKVASPISWKESKILRCLVKQRVGRRQQDRGFDHSGL